jgi:hypothetical protein
MFLIAPPGVDLAAADEPSSAAENAVSHEATARITGYVSSEGNFFFGPKQRVVITRVDHEKVPGPRLNSFQSNAQTLSPGMHIITVEASVNNMHAGGRLWLDAQAGKSYIVRKRTVGYGVHFWIEETDTGRVVGGEQSGED